MDNNITIQKNSIIQGILNTENPETLQELQEILMLEKPCPSLLSDTPENIKKIALLALEQEKNGQFKTHEETLREFGITE